MNHLTVSQFNEIINIQLGTLGEFEIEGEITAINITPKGGVFMTLKDQLEPAIVNLSGYKPTIDGFDLVEEGMMVVVYGTANLYSPNGRFSVSIRKISPQGEGSLAIAYQKLKQKLEQEGLFDQQRKRSIPPIITRISLITGKDSAAYTDFVKIIQENGLSLDIDYYPVHVQGSNAVNDMVIALDMANRSNSDIIVIVRGGGSLEDLAAFNEETLARMIFASDKPTIVGVGHERDESIADFVADVRASTPSQAAYYIIDNVNNILANNDRITEAIFNSITKVIDWNLLKVTKSIEYISSKIESNFIKSEMLTQKVLMIDRNLEILLDSKLSILNQIPYVLQKLNSLIDICDSKVLNSKQLLKAYNPINILKKGYAVLKCDNITVRSASDIKVDDIVKLVLHDGSAESKILNIKLKNNDSK